MPIQSELYSLPEQSTTQPTNSTVRLLYPADSRPVRSGYAFVDSTIDQETGIHWWRLKADCPAKFTPEVVLELRRFQTEFAADMRRIAQECGPDAVPGYHVLSSEIDGIFNLGGDLGYFYQQIRNQDRAALRRYARACVELVYQNSIAMDLPMTTIALVKGNAMGGGMEAALSAHIIVAERQVKMGLPEVLFNMFPGMGAYQFLSRRLTPKAAERLILGGKMYSAEELYEIGVVDHLAETGEGDQVVERLVRRERNQRGAAMALRKAIRADNPVSRESLMDFVETWVDTAMSLDDNDLKHMQYLIRSQRCRGL